MSLALRTQNQIRIGISGFLNSLPNDEARKNWRRRIWRKGLTSCELRFIVDRYSNERSR